MRVVAHLCCFLQLPPLAVVEDVEKVAVLQREPQSMSCIAPLGLLFRQHQARESKMLEKMEEGGLSINGVTAPKDRKNERHSLVPQKLCFLLPLSVIVREFLTDIGYRPPRYRDRLSNLRHPIFRIYGIKGIKGVRKS